MHVKHKICTFNTNQNKFSISLVVVVFLLTENFKLKQKDVCKMDNKMRIEKSIWYRLEILDILTTN